MTGATAFGLQSPDTKFTISVTQGQIQVHEYAIRIFEKVFIIEAAKVPRH
jgi:hypothetical protein